MSWMAEHNRRSLEDRTVKGDWEVEYFDDADGDPVYWIKNHKTGEEVDRQWPDRESAQKYCDQLNRPD